MTAAFAVGALAASGAFLVFGASDVAETFAVSGEVAVREVYGDLCPDLIDRKALVLNEAGAVIAVGLVGSGSQASNGSCRYPFTVTEVPSGHSTYGVALPGLNEPSRFYRGADLRAGMSLQLVGTYGT